MQDTINTIKARIGIAQAFADKYGPKIPEGFPGDLSFWNCTFGGNPSYSMRIPKHFENGANRETLLATAGEIFGKDGWTRELNDDREAFDWKKTLDGIDLKISRAELIDDPRDKTPVRPNEFPLLLGAPGETKETL